MDRDKIEKIIQVYLQDLSAKIKIDTAILFGSALSGKFSEGSDIDLLILSSEFRKMSDSDRFDLLYTSRLSKVTQSTPMDIFGLTPEEYKNADPLSITGEIKDTGRELIIM